MLQMNIWHTLDDTLFWVASTPWDAHGCVKMATKSKKT